MSAPSPPPELKHRPSPVMTGLSGSEEPGPRRRSAGVPSPSAPPPQAASPAISGARRYDFKQGGEEEGEEVEGRTPKAAGVVPRARRRRSGANDRADHEEERDVAEEKMEEVAMVPRGRRRNRGSISKD